MFHDLGEDQIESANQQTSILVQMGAVTSQEKVQGKLQTDKGTDYKTCLKQTCFNLTLFHAHTFMSVQYIDMKNSSL